MTDFLSVDPRFSYVTPVVTLTTSEILSCCAPSTTSLLVTIIGASVYHNYILQLFCLFVCLLCFYS